MKFSEILKISSEHLKESGVDESSANAELLILHAAGIDRLNAYRDNPEIDEKTFSKVSKLLERRAEGEPVQYITGQIEFLGLKIKVGRGLLIPRPETELLAQEAIKEVKTQNPKLAILDLCAGSGCIAIALAKELSDADIYGTDISKISIRYANRNARINKIKNVSFLAGSLFEPVEELKFDLIVSNPPYIKTADIQALQREIKDWEPVEALDGGRDGLNFYRKIFSEAGKHMKKHGKIILEVGFDQAKDVKEIAKQSGFKKISFIKDFAGIERILKLV